MFHVPVRYKKQFTHFYPITLPNGNIVYKAYLTICIFLVIQFGCNYLPSSDMCLVVHLNRKKWLDICSASSRVVSLAPTSTLPSTLNYLQNLNNRTLNMTVLTYLT